MISNPQKILESGKRSQLGFPDVQLQINLNQICL